jgi:acetyl-CoA synthetase
MSTHAGQEMDYILSGQLRISINGHEETMRAGDSVYYDSSKPHGMVAVGGTPCVFLAIVMGPAVLDVPPS